jgi:YHS domain-containing protein
MKKQLGTVLIILSFVATAGAIVRADQGNSGATTAPVAVDVKNTKCLVAKDDVGDSRETVTYDGKIYHLCCSDCKEKFNADPVKYVKAFDKDPGAYGVAK